MEELELTTPVVEPEKVTTTFKVISVLLDLESLLVIPTPTQSVGPIVKLRLKDNLDKPYDYQYTGQTALDMIKFMNTANFTTKSMHKRILERLSADGVLPGTVTGAPDPPA
jgi:hypothetical protein